MGLTNESKKPEVKIEYDSDSNDILIDADDEKFLQTQSKVCSNILVFLDYPIITYFSIYL